MDQAKIGDQHSKTAAKIFWLVITLIPLIGLLWSFSDPISFYETQEQYRSEIAAFGIIAPLVFVTFQALQVVVTPINHYSVGVAGGFLYGPVYGALLNWLGRMIGHIAAFFIARFLGRKIARRFVAKETLEKYDRYISNQSLALFVVYFLPLFPDDEISYLAGLSKMKFKTFFFANFFGQIGGSLGLAYLGSGVNTKDAFFWIFLLITLAGFPVLWWLTIKNNPKQKNPATQP